MKQQLISVLDKVNLVPSRRPPFVERRYPDRGQRRTARALGPELSKETIWSASADEPRGELAAVFSHTNNIHKWVHYLPIYEELFDRARPIKLLEIGVFHGGSLRMWREYLHPDSLIVGIDIDPECEKFGNEASNVHVRIGGQQDTKFLQTVIDEFGLFDVILDDGSHKTSHMIESFRYLFLAGLSKKGTYIAEDVHSSYWKSYRDSRNSFVDFTRYLIDAMHAHYRETEMETQFRLSHDDEVQSLKVPMITPLLDSVEIHDSVVVIRKANRNLPRSIYR